MNMDLDTLLEKISKQPAVLADDFDRFYAVYFPSFPLSELEQRWNEIGSIPLGRGYPDVLYGEWLELSEEFIEENFTSLEMAISKAYGRLPYHIRLCCDEDSALYTPTGKVVFHRGLDTSESDYRHEHYGPAKLRYKQWQKEQANES